MTLLAREAIPRILEECVVLYQRLVEVAAEADFSRFTPGHLVAMAREADWRLTLANTVVASMGETRLPPGDFEADGYHAPFLIEALKDYQPRLLHYEGTCLVSTFTPRHLRDFFRGYVHAFAAPVATGYRALQVLGQDFRKYAIPRWALAHLLLCGLERFAEWDRKNLTRLQKAVTAIVEKKLLQWKDKERALVSHDVPDVAAEALFAILEEIRLLKHASTWKLIEKAGQGRADGLGYLYAVVDRAAQDKVLDKKGRERRIPQDFLDPIEAERPDSDVAAFPREVYEEEIAYPQPSFTPEMKITIDTRSSMTDLRCQLTEKVGAFAATYIEARITLQLDPKASDAFTEEGRLKDVAAAKHLGLSPDAFAKRKQRWEAEHDGTTLEEWWRRLQNDPEISPLLLALAFRLYPPQ